MKSLAKKTLTERIKGLLPSRKDAEETAASMYQPDVEEAAILRDCNDLLRSAKECKESKAAVFDEAYDFIFLNKHWKEKKPKSMSDYSGNMLFSNVLHKAALVTDSRPMYNISPTLPLPVTVTDPDTGQPIELNQSTVLNLKKILEDYGWYHWGLEQTIDEAALWIFSMGAAIVKVNWDETAAYGKGDVSPEIVSPYNFYISKDAGWRIQDAYYSIEAHIMMLDDIRIAWPDKGKYVQPSNDFSEFREEKRHEQSDAAGLTAASAGTPNYGSNPWGYVENGKKRSGDYAVEKAVVYEMWIKDKTLITEEKEIYEMGVNPATGQQEEMLKMDELGAVVKESVTRLKYPKGRVIFWSGNVVLDDKPNPYDDGKRPYAVSRAYSTPGTFWGTGEYEAHHKSQRAFNRIVCQIIDYLNGCNIKHVIEGGSLKNNKKITNQAHEVVELNRGGTYQIIGPPPYTPQAFQMIDTIKGVYDEESGIHDISRGEKTPGLDKVGIALTLKESDFTRLRPIIRDFERFLSEIGELCLSRIIQYQGVARDYTFVDPMTGQPATVTLAGFPKNTDLFFKVNVKTNSTLPADKSSRSAMAIQLFQMGVVGPEQLLKAVEWPDVPGAMQEQQQAQMAQMAAAGGMPPGGAPPGMGPDFIGQNAAATNPQAQIPTADQRMAGGMPQMMSDVQMPQVLAQ